MSVVRLNQKLPESSPAARRSMSTPRKRLSVESRVAQAAEAAPQARPTCSGATRRPQVTPGSAFEITVVGAHLAAVGEADAAARVRSRS